MRANLKAAAIAALILLCGAAPSSAQAQQADQSESVTVTGRLDPPTLGTEIRRFVRGHARLTRIDQLARWRDPICVRVSNLPDAYGEFIANRILTVARESGARVNDESGCTPNVSIVFTPEPQAVLDNIRAERPELLGYHFIGQRRAVATMMRPIQAWYVTATSSGMVTAIDESMRDPPTGITGSRLSQGLESIFVHVLILVNSNDVADAPVGPISDYLAMLSLTDVSEETWACGGLLTILELFSGNCTADAPQELTTPDRAFLQGLYTMNADSLASLQRAHISDRMRDTLTSDEPARE